MATLTRHLVEKELQIVSRDCRCVEDYELLKQLYRGKASLLYRAVCRRSRQTVALKLYRKHKLSTLNWYQVAVLAPPPRGGN